MRTGILSVGFALSTVKSDLISGEINHRSSVASMNVINSTQHIDTTAPANVGWVRSLGIFLYMSNFFTSNPILHYFRRYSYKIGRSCDLSLQHK